MRKLSCKILYVKWLTVANGVKAKEIKEDVAEDLSSV